WEIVMRPQDKQVFLEATHTLGLWILVRRTNPASLRYIGLPGYQPKPLDCKPKTADRDVGNARLAGLVVDPVLCPQAFSATKLVDATDKWKRYSPPMLRSGRYSVDNKDPRSPTYGLLRLGRDALHGDYDLYDIIDPAQAQRNLAAVETLLGQPHRRGAFFTKVQSFVNTRIGVPMIQHGGEMQYADHSEQSIDAFGPAGEDVTILNQFSVRAWYKDKFAGRVPLG
ncbi:MAG: hypothetical protein WD045_07395, partial [Pirellulaceae bacterium]